jgi:hypothetical protein
MNDPLDTVERWAKRHPLRSFVIGSLWVWLWTGFRLLWWR